MSALLTVESVTRSYAMGGLLGRGHFDAVKDLSFEMSGAPEIFTIVGESGSGKSTLSKMILALVPPSKGRILIEGMDLAGLRGGRAHHDFMARVQPIFQNPFEAFNPLKSVDRYLIATAKNFVGAHDQAAAVAASDAALRQVGLSFEEISRRYPHELSGGQLQRVAIARALIPRPRLIVADEPVSMVDASLRMSIVNLFRALRDDLGLSIIYITHDLATAYYISDRIIVMQSGQVVEAGPARVVLDDPQHEYTRRLKAAVLSVDPPDRTAALGAIMATRPRKITRGTIMHHASLSFDRNEPIGITDRRLFGAFVEHLGRCVYGGLYEPGHPTATPEGFRGDVLDLVRELGPTIIRYPGGNFVSGYDWEDGVGPVENRPKRMELAWLTIEPNTFGTNEFIDWCRAAELEPMLAVNLGTRGPDGARRMVEYCNFSGGTALSDLRKEHGWEQPHEVKFWCLGNEMDGPWQMGAKTATEYGRVASEAAKMMRLVDPSIELAAVGSSGRNMPTFGAWEREVLRHCYEQVEFISLHTYLNDYAKDTSAFLASSDLMDGFIEEVAGICDEIQAEKGSARQVHLSFDEWNVWYRTRRGDDRKQPGWPIAPPILEEVYTMKDALAFGGAVISLLNHADRVKCACLAQLVNAIAPILTENGGAAWRQPIFWPFADFSRLGRGEVLRANVDSPTYATVYRDPRGTTQLEFPLPEVPYLKASVVRHHDGVALFLLNRSLDSKVSLEVNAKGFGPFDRIEGTMLRHDDLEATNTRDGERVRPVSFEGCSQVDGVLTLTLSPASWTVVRLSM